MILAIDAGNSTIAFGLITGDSVVGHWRLSSKSVWTSDELLLHLEGLLRIGGADIAAVEQVVMSSVVPALTNLIRDGVRKLFDSEPVVVSAALPVPVKVVTDNPGELGGDLLANAVAGHSLAGGAAIVVDFGTALTFTAVDAGARVRGAAIAPGLSTGFRGLVAHTASLPMVELSDPGRFIGTDTTSALRSGMVNGYAGLVDRIVGGMRDELGGTVTAFGTGGEVAHVAPLCRQIDRVEPWLTLRGLAEIGRAIAGGQVQST